MSIGNLISLLSGVALFLFGMALMGDGLKKVAGSKLEVVLYRLTGTPLKGFLLGTGVTAVIQSSSATSVMVVGFVNSGMMKVRQAINIVMGAILGTSITGWVRAWRLGCRLDGAFLHGNAHGRDLDRGHCAADVLQVADKAAYRRYPDGLCRFDVRHEHDERLGRAAA